MSTEENCVDPEVGRLLFRWAMLHGAKLGCPQDPALTEHLARCPACQHSVGLWLKQLKASELLAEARRVLSGNLTSKDRVEEKKMDEGERLLFSFSVEHPLKGLLIRVAADGRITEVSVADRTSFDKG